MTYSIVYDAIQIKIKRFEKPAPLINTNEVAAAVILCCHQANITPPELSAGMTIREFRTKFFQIIDGQNSVDPKLLALIREYPDDSQVIDELAVGTYQFGLNSHKSPVTPN